jgi:hypothetical protein
MRRPVTLLFDSATRFPAFLEFSVTTTITLTFVDRNDGERLVVDDLRNYRTIQVRESSTFEITLIGNDAMSPRTFVFETSEGFNDFFQLFASGAAHFQLSPVPEDPRTFVLHPPPLPKIVDTIIHAGDRFENYLHGLPPQRPVDGINSGVILPVLPSSSPPPLDLYAAQTLDLSAFDWGSRPLSPDAWPVVWRRLLNVGDLAAEYGQVKRQWEVLTLGQWEHWEDFRVFVKSVDDVLAGSDFPKRLFFDVLVTVFTDVFGKVASKEALLFVGQAMFLVFVGREKNGNFEFVDGRVLSPIDAGSFLFGCIREAMAALFKEVPRKRVLDGVRGALAAVSPSTLAMVEDRGPDALAELVDRTPALFMAGRRPDEAVVLMAHAVARRDLAAFRTDLLCVVLAMLHGRLQQVPRRAPERFMQTFESESGRLDAQLLVLNLGRVGGRHRL